MTNLRIGPEGLLKYCSALLLLIAHAPHAMAQQLPAVPKLGEIRVHGDAEGERASIANARAAAASIPGNVSIVPASVYGEGIVMGLGDALSRTPGVYAKTPSGQVSAKVSIRGSGISSGGLRGIRLLRDGLPLGRSDDLGDTIYADPSGASYIEVYRGASSLQYGAATLGGAINMVSPTAHTNPGVELRAESGSNGYMNAQLRAGKVFDNGVDAYASVSSNHSDGFRQNSAHTVNRFYGNVGYQFGDGSRGRLHVTSEHYRVRMPGPLTLAQLQEDPSAANASALQADSRIRTSPRWHLAYQHDWHIGATDQLSIGAFHTGTKFDSPGSDLRARYDATDYGLAMRHQIDRNFGEHGNRFVWGASYSQGFSDNQAYWPDYRLVSPFLPAPGAQLASLESSRSSFELFGENSYRLRPDVALIVGAQATWAKRRTDNHLVPLAKSFYADGSASANYFGFNPKIGMIWDVRPDAQIYANVSRSFEPPNSLSFHTPAGELQAQRATTVEFGTRGGDADFGWDAAVYHSRLKNELLLVPVPGNPALPPLAHNADSTRHVGAELGLHGRWRLASLSGSLDWSLAYTWNRFQFVDDQIYGNNALPGIPEHVGRIEIVYRHSSGFYAGPNVDLASGWQVDQANTLEAPGYGIVNFTVGYEPPSGDYRVFLDARNLANKYYAATTDYVLNAHGRDVAAFYPGQTRAIFVGVQAYW